MAVLQQAEKRPGERFQETSVPMMRPWQVQKLEEEQANLQNSIQAKDVFRIADMNVAMARKRLSTIKVALSEQAPRAYASTEINAVRKRHDELLASIQDGMCTQAEMRRCPPGATDKHRAWMNRKKKEVLELKNIRLRLHASGALGDDFDHASDVANIEQFRPVGGSGELSMDKSQIAGKEFHMAYVPSSVVMSDTEIETLEKLDPDLARSLCVASPEMRQAIKDALAPILNGGKADVAEKDEEQVEKEATVLTGAPVFDETMNLE